MKCTSRISLRLCLPALLVVVFSGLNQARAGEKALVVNATNLAGWQTEARQSHPTVSAARGRMEAARISIGAVRLWEDPMVGLGLTAARMSMRRDDGDVTLMVEQQLPRRKLFSAQQEKALSETRVAQAEVAMAGNMLELEVAKAALELALADEALVIVQEESAWIEKMSANAKEKLKDPAATAAEPLRLQSELAQQIQKVETAKRERTRFSQQLNLMMGRPAERPWPALALPQTTDAVTAAAGDWAALIARHPRLAALRYKANTAGAAVAIAQEEQKPMVRLSLESNLYHEGDFRDAMLGVRVTLPWWNRSSYKANEERARQEEAAARKDIESAELELGSQAVAAITEARNAERQTRAFTSEVLPPAEKAAQAVESSWISGKATLAEVLEARRSLLAARLEQRRSLAACEAALATLRALRGGR